MNGFWSNIKKEIMIQSYSCLVAFIAILLRCISPWAPRVQRFLTLRELDSDLLRRFAQLKRDGREVALFFCSSAGEFEQAKPLIARWMKVPARDVHVFLFSQSGMEYLKARGESLSHSKAPIDTIGNWRKIMRVLQPSICFVVKYELWPAFLVAAKETSRLILVDGVVSDRLRKRFWSRHVRGFFLGYFDRIFVVGEADRAFFCSELGVDPSLVMVSGDTKYDRVRERALISDEQAINLRRKMDEIFGPAKRFIVGSGWHKDIELVLMCCRSLYQAKLLDGWQLVIAPHLIEEDMISWIVDQCKQSGLACCRYSQIEYTSGHSGYGPCQVLILDKMGMLAEFYACGQAAFVGGGLHHQVHNVLEPAIRGLFLAFGPRYHNSAEACLLVGAGLAQVIENEQRLYDWWRNLIEIGVSVHNELLKRVHDLCGSADTIMDKLS